MEHKKSSSLSKLVASDHQPVHKMIMAHLLLSVSIFSFLFSYYSLCSSSPLYSPKFNNYFSANSFQLPSHALMNKNYIFLICNGLLVFLAKTSGLVLSSSGSFDLNDMLQKKIGDGLLTYYNISLETKEPAILNKEVFETKEVEKRVIEEEEILNEEPPKEVSIFIAESDEEQGAATGSRDLFQHIEEEEKEVVFPPATDRGGGGGEEEEEEEEEEEDDAELLSTEELNQKFEEFIRKMKEEIMINEARDRQLVIVK